MHRDPARRLRLGAAAALLVAASAGPALAVPFGGVEFPQGAASFADAVVGFTVGAGGVSDPHDDPANALGTPDFTNVSCSVGNCSYVSLGSGGSLTLRFVDNVLTGSGDADDDLWIFEIGPDVEDTFVEVSENGSVWLSVGSVTGSTRGIDIDAFGHGLASAFSFVRLTDDPNEGAGSGSTVGADIDAVGAISTRLVVVETPEPAALALFAGGLAALSWRRRRSVVAAN